ncbi:hypothetical protein D3C71_1894120 [compost metagenome]
MVTAGTQSGFRDIQHGNRGENTGDREPEQQRHVSGFAAGVSHRQHTGTNVGADNHCNRLDEGQAFDFQSG